jgi:hypothetical protein
MHLSRGLTASSELANHISRTRDESRLPANDRAGVRHRVDCVAGNKQPIWEADTTRLGAGERAVWVVKVCRCVPLWPPRVPETGS